MASTEVDILSIHETVMKNFEEERGKLETYKERLIAIEKVLSLHLQFSIRKNLESECASVRKKINEIESRKTEDFYVMETAEILQNYTKILRKPKNVSFMGVVEAGEDEKLPLVHDYLRIAQNFIPNISVVCAGSAGSGESKKCSKTPIIERQTQYIGVLLYIVSFQSQVLIFYQDSVLLCELQFYQNLQLDIN